MLCQLHYLAVTKLSEQVTGELKEQDDSVLLNARREASNHLKTDLFHKFFHTKHTASTNSKEQPCQGVAGKPLCCNKWSFTPVKHGSQCILEVLHLVP